MRNDSVRFLVTGSRDWHDVDTLVTALVDAWRDLGKPLQPVLVHGACPTGLDAMADDLWSRLWRWPVERHPADWDRWGKAAGPRRNQEMVDAGADVCLAFPHPDSRGTTDCMARAQAAGIPLRTFPGRPAARSVSTSQTRGEVNRPRGQMALPIPGPTPTESEGLEG